MPPEKPVDHKITTIDPHRRIGIEDLFYGTATVGERGQIVIPAQARREYDIETGDKLLIMGHPQKHGLMLCKIDVMREFMTEMIEGLKIVESHASTLDGDEELPA